MSCANSSNSDTPQEPFGASTVVDAIPNLPKEDNELVEAQETISVLQEDDKSHGVLQHWDFQLPILHGYDGVTQLRLSLENQSSSFDPTTFARAIQTRVGVQMLQNYLDQCGDASVKGRINEEVEGFPLMFYVVQSNNERLLRYIVERGGNP
jgi:hypothetical protein